MDNPRPPPYPPDTRAKGWRFELNYEQIDQSDTWALAASAGQEGRPLLLMQWLVAWRQTPCGSLPADESIIAALVGISTKTWAKYRSVLMRGWWKADDGRLYHPTLTQRVAEMMRKRRSDADRQAGRRAKTAAEVPSDTDGLTRESRVTPDGLGSESSTGTGTDIPPTEANASSGGRAPEAYGLISGALRRAGVPDAAPHNLRFRALVDAGATQDEFCGYATKAVAEADGSPFLYLLGIVEGERKRAAKNAGKLHQGPMPGKAPSAAELRVLQAVPGIAAPHLRAQALTEYVEVIDESAKRLG